jgi:choline-sulfatase
MRLLYVDIDTLRADHLGCYGYERATTPNIDALAADGVRFANVYASDVPCLPSRAALLTGTFGIRNGVVSHGGSAADLRYEGAERGFVSRYAFDSWAGALYWNGWHTASLSSFPFRHSATWWNHGFQEAMNLMRGMGAERADQVLPEALDWLERRGRADDWFLHVHLWDPHTPYNVPEEYSNPFASDPVPAWHTEEVRAHNWQLAGPHAAQEPWGFTPDEWGPPPPRQPWNASSMDAVKAIFDGYDVGVRYADDALGTLMNKLDDLGVAQDTAVLVSSDHGEAFGELGVYADHQAADEATCHIPAVLRWPGLEPCVHDGLQYHFDVAATVLGLAGVRTPHSWDGRSIEIGGAGRDHLVLSQGAWSCQRGVRFDDYLYLRTWHDGYHPHWTDEMLFDLAGDAHETNDLFGPDVGPAGRGASLLEDWTAEQLARTGREDPMEVVRTEGGPYHVRKHLGPYLERLRATGREAWAEVLVRRHGDEL